MIAYAHRAQPGGGRPSASARRCVWTLSTGMGAAVLDEAKRILQETFGHHEFRGLQEPIIQRVIQGEHVLAVMATGSGKSLCYQIPAIMRPGVGIVVSPLIALMQDQVGALQQRGVRAEVINSTFSSEENRRVLDRAAAGEIDLLYMAPERLTTPHILDTLDRLPISLFAIDEAHCISMWGHEFRPSYLELSVIAQRFPDVPRIALTATATTLTRADIIRRLRLGPGRGYVPGFV